MSADFEYGSIIRQHIAYEQGQWVLVVSPIQSWQKMLDELEELNDILLCDVQDAVLIVEVTAPVTDDLHVVWLNRLRGCVLTWPNNF